jgi:hypothetical protein
MGSGGFRLVSGRRLEAFEVIDVIRKGFLIDAILGTPAFFFGLKEVDVDQLFQVMGYGRLGEVKAFSDGCTLGPIGILPDIFQHLYAIRVAEGFTHALQSFRI